MPDSARCHITVSNDSEPGSDVVAANNHLHFHRLVIVFERNLVSNTDGVGVFVSTFVQIRTTTLPNMDLYMNCPS